MFGGFAGHLLNKSVHFHVCGDFPNILGSLLGRTCSGCGFRLQAAIAKAVQGSVISAGRDRWSRHCGCLFGFPVLDIARLEFVHEGGKRRVIVALDDPNQRNKVSIVPPPLVRHVAHEEPPLVIRGRNNLVVVGRHYHPVH